MPNKKRRPNPSEFDGTGVEISCWQISSTRSKKIKSRLVNIETFFYVYCLRVERPDERVFVSTCLIEFDLRADLQDNYSFAH